MWTLQRDRATPPPAQAKKVLSMFFTIQQWGMTMLNNLLWQLLSHVALRTRRKDDVKKNKKKTGGNSCSNGPYWKRRRPPHCQCKERWISKAVVNYMLWVQSQNMSKFAEETPLYLDSTAQQTIAHQHLNLSSFSAATDLRSRGMNTRIKSPLCLSKCVCAPFAMCIFNLHAEEKTPSAIHKRRK